MTGTGEPLEFPEMEPREFTQLAAWAKSMAEGKGASSSESPKARPAFAGTRRQLSEDELKSSGVQKLLLEEIYKLDQENSVLQNYRERFHEADKDVAVLQSERKKSAKLEALYSLSLASGSILIGRALPMFESGDSFGAYATGGLGILLLGAAILTKVLGK
ncbi:MAG: hypothetical protein F4X12_00760 [Acidobacteriia bacterium]|nr:hypothetical protein [Terriglobia bacterium]